MSRHLAFIDPDSIPDVIPPVDGDQDEFLDACQKISDGFSAQGCVEAGTDLCKQNKRERVRDPAWGGDIASFMIRALPHEQSVDKVISIVQLHLETLVAEVDDLDELCTWRYTEN